MWSPTQKLPTPQVSYLPCLAFSILISQMVRGVGTENYIWRPSEMKNIPTHCSVFTKDKNKQFSDKNILGYKLSLFQRLFSQPPSIFSRA